MQEERLLWTLFRVLSIYSGVCMGLQIQCDFCSCPSEHHSY